VVRHFLQAQQFADPMSQHHCECSNEKLLQARQKRSVDAQPDEAQREKHGERAEDVPEKNLRAGGERLALQEAKQTAEQNAHCVDEGADRDCHAQTQPLRGPGAKPEIFCACPQSLLLKGGWPM